MGVFRLLASEHIPHPDENAKDYNTGESKDKFVTGDIVESEYDLDEMFVNKFDRLDGKLSKEHRDRDHMLDRGGTNRVMDLPRATKLKVSKTAKSRAARGEDPNANVQVGRPEFNRPGHQGKVIVRRGPANDEDLVEEEDDNYPASKMQSEEDEDNSGVGIREESEFGSDVTKDFPSAKAGKFKVFKDEDEKFTVVDRTEPDESLHEERFGSDEEVETFMEDTMTEREEAKKKTKTAKKAKAPAKKGKK